MKFNFKNKFMRKLSSPKAAFIFAGVSSTIWFLSRVIPKPSRAAYPCMRAAAPIMSSFIIWGLSLLGVAAFYRKTKVSIARSRYLYAGLFAVALFVSAATFVAQNANSIYANLVADAPVSLSPIGVAKGIFPGRVAWVYNPDAATWKGEGFYWDAAVNPQAEYDKSFTEGIKSLSGGKDDATSWNLIFKWFNNSHERPGTGYQAGDKIAIKINMNNADSPAIHAKNRSNANPQACVAVVRSLVNAGVPQKEIWIGDPSRAVTDNVFNAIHSAYPDVNVVDYFGNDGRVTTTTVPDVFPNEDVVTGQSKCFYDARYIVNMPLLKGHVGQGITFGSKNFYGINGIKPVWSDNGNRHPLVSALANYMTNPKFAGKTILWAMDATYPNRDLDGTPQASWAEAPFNGRPASSFIMSLDGVAEESVSLDFFFQHYADEVNQFKGFGYASGYMVTAAKAGLGVQEHWNNDVDRKYSKNLDPKANGIELVYVTKPWPAAK
jgi:hypothetical protein